MPNTTANDTTVVVRAGFLAFLETWIAVVMVTGITGNLITMTIVGRFRRLRNSGGILIAMLSLSDALFYGTVLPLRACTFYYGTWIWPELLCEFVAGLSHLLFGVSMCCMAAIAFNRYLLVLHPALFQRAFGRACLGVQLAGIWIFVAVLVLVLPLSGAWGQYGYKQATLSCTYNSNEHRSHRLVVNSLGMVVPCVFIITCYSLIFHKVRTSRAKLHSWGTQTKTRGEPSEHKAQLPHIPERGDAIHTINTPNNAIGTMGRDKKKTVSINVTATATDAGSSASKTHNKRKESKPSRKEELKMTVTMVCTFAVFLVTLFPYYVFMLLSPDSHASTAYLLSIALTWVNGCINPVLYVAMNAQYRQAYRALFCGKGTNHHLQQQVHRASTHLTVTNI